MKVILFGVGLANTLTTEAINYKASQGSIFANSHLRDLVMLQLKTVT